MTLIEEYMKPDKVVACPYGCPPDAQIEIAGTRTTLVGWSTGEDPNHWTMLCRCTSCRRRFDKEWIIRGGEVAYVDDHEHLIAGVALHCCRAKYLVRCDCGGWRAHAVRGHGEGYKVAADGRWVPTQPMFWQCGGPCGRKFPDEQWGEEFMERGAP